MVHRLDQVNGLMPELFAQPIEQSVSYRHLIEIVFNIVRPAKFFMS
jgi:hypothetical protein